VPPAQALAVRVTDVPAQTLVALTVIVGVCGLLTCIVIEFDDELTQRPTVQVAE
jgi:hypothetical protein